MKRILLSLIIFLSVFTLYLYYVQDNNKIVYKNTVNNSQVINSNNLTMMYETEADSGEYQVSGDTSWPQDGYIFNETLSKCENGSTLTWDEENKKVVMQANTSDKCYVYFDIYVQEERTSTEMLEYLNLTVNNGTPNFSNIATQDEGVYQMEDNLGISYYFRGNVDNNYVYYAGFYWRIIRINGNGTLRIIYDGTTPHRNGEISTDRNIGTYNLIAGSMDYNYMMGYSSNMLYSWYEENILNLGYSTYVSDSIFCNDVEILTSESDDGGGGFTTNTYKGVDRVNNSAPSLMCNKTIYSANTEIGNGLLNYPIALITADELLIAGANNVSNNELFYLYSVYELMTMTPNSYTIGVGYGSYYTLESTGIIGTIGTAVRPTIYIRPVISLNSDIILTGDGTIDNPFQIK